MLDHSHLCRPLSPICALLRPVCLASGRLGNLLLRVPLSVSADGHVHSTFLVTQEVIEIVSVPPTALHAMSRLPYLAHGRHREVIAFLPDHVLHHNLLPGIDIHLSLRALRPICPGLLLLREPLSIASDRLASDAFIFVAEEKFIVTITVLLFNRSAALSPLAQLLPPAGAAVRNSRRRCIVVNYLLFHHKNPSALGLALALAQIALTILTLGCLILLLEDVD